MTFALNELENELFMNPPPLPQKQISQRVFEKSRKQGVKERQCQKNEFLKLLSDKNLSVFYKFCCVCGWNETTVDLAHIVPNRKYGVYHLNNIVPLCPNHHRTFDYQIMPIEEKIIIESFVRMISYTS